MENISSRLKKYIAFRNVSIRAFEKSMKWGNSTVNNLKDNISTDKLLELKDNYPDLNLGWLTSGQGTMTVSNYLDDPFAPRYSQLKNIPDKKSDALEQLSRVQNKNGKNETKPVKDTIFHTVEAYILPIKGRLGLGSSYYADDYFDRELDKTTVSITEKPLNANRFVIAEFEGDSMTNGEPNQIPHGSWLILAERKRGEDWETNMEGKIMGFYDRDDNFTVKRVKKHDPHFGYVVLEALNPDKSQPENQDRELQIKNCWAIYDYINKLS